MKIRNFRVAVKVKFKAKRALAAWRSERAGADLAGAFGLDVAEIELLKSHPDAAAPASLDDRLLETSGPQTANTVTAVDGGPALCASEPVVSKSSAQVRPLAQGAPGEAFRRAVALLGSIMRRWRERRRAARG